MSDVALNAPENTQPKRSGKKDKSNGKKCQAVAEAKVQRERADAAEARIRDIEEAPTLIVKMDDSELSNMNRDKRLTDAAVSKANALLAEAADARMVALMLNSAYNASWVSLKKKYGLPEDVDVDWTTGEVFRKKISIQVDSLEKD